MKMLGMRPADSSGFDSATEQSKQTRVDETWANGDQPAVSRPRISLAPADLAVSDAEATSRSGALAVGSGYQAVGGQRYGGPCTYTYTAHAYKHEGTICT
ncbi:hypothetical protein GGI43DRAFT_268796 [Trichoderma evansii]